MPLVHRYDGLHMLDHNGTQFPVPQFPHEFPGGNVTFHFSGSHLGAVWFRFILFLPCAYGRFLPVAGGNTTSKGKGKKRAWASEGRELIPNRDFEESKLRVMGIGEGSLFPEPKQCTLERKCFRISVHVRQV